MVVSEWPSPDSESEQGVNKRGIEGFCAYHMKEWCTAARHCRDPLDIHKFSARASDAKDHRYLGKYYTVELSQEFYEYGGEQVLDQ